VSKPPKTCLAALKIKKIANLQSKLNAPLTLAFFIGQTIILLNIRSFFMASLMAALVLLTICAQKAGPIFGFSLVMAIIFIGYLVFKNINWTRGFNAVNFIADISSQRATLLAFLWAVLLTAYLNPNKIGQAIALYAQPLGQRRAAIISLAFSLACGFFYTLARHYKQRQLGWLARGGKNNLKAQAILLGATLSFAFKQADDKSSALLAKGYQFCYPISRQTGHFKASCLFYGSLITAQLTSYFMLK
jgi:energy-coupling factor transporter transmembrane protein EcfT